MIGNQKVIGLCIGKINDAVCHSFIENLSEVLWKQNAKLFVYTASSDFFWGKDSEYGEEYVFSLIDYDIVDALIVFSNQIKREEVREWIITEAKKHEVPVFCATGKHPDAVNVYFDNNDGFRMIMEHVMNVHKPKTVHFIAGFKGNEMSETREAVFREVLTQKGIAVGEDMISYGDFWSTPTEAAVRKLVEEKRVPEAIVCANDVMAITTCDILKKYGYRIPQDVIVTGFDGFEEIYYSIPQISSCECDYRDIAVKIAELLPMVLNGILKVGNYPVNSRLLLSQSCGCSKGRSLNYSMYTNNLRNQIYQLQENQKILSEVDSVIPMLESVGEASKMLHKSRIENMYCFLPKSCIDVETNPMEQQPGEDLEEDMLLFYDSNSEPDFEPEIFPRKKIIPELDEKMKDSYPLIFLSLYFGKLPLGYVCFHYEDYDLFNYMQIPQIIISLNHAVSGYRNACYQRNLMRHIEELYRLDGLTKLLNRAAFYKEFGELMQSLSDAEQVTLLLADLDGLKSINDTYGHNEGDLAIKAVADAIRSVATPDAICCRFGGDEMLMATKNQIDLEEAKVKFYHFFEAYNSESGKPYRVSASVGLYMAAKEDAHDFETMLKRADKVMYIEKDSRKKKD